MNKKTKVLIGIGVIALIVIGVLAAGGIGKNNEQNWQVIQSVRGKITIRDRAGYYPKWFATVTTYPRYVSKEWNDVIGEGEKDIQSVRTTFNDGGTAKISMLARYATPKDETKRVEFHRLFQGLIEESTKAVKAHLTTCIKTTGPLMSASEHQSARKSEFTSIVEGQLINGLYKMKRVEQEIAIELDPLEIEEGTTVKTPVPRVEMRMVTELVLDSEGNPIVKTVSPLEAYGIVINQFSITLTDYDPEILKQFAAKKESFLAAEQSKADREKEKQERLNIIEKGLREVAEAKAAANVIKETAVVEAQQKAEVAGQAKVEAETKASMALEVAKIAKEEAQVKLETAELDAKAIERLAEAERKKIELAGALTELEQAMIDAQVQMAKEVADGISKINVPSVMFMGGGEGGGSQDIMENLINLKLLYGTGVLDKTSIEKSVVERAIDRTPTATVAPAPNP